MSWEWGWSLLTHPSILVLLFLSLYSLIQFCLPLLTLFLTWQTALQAFTACHVFCQTSSPFLLLFCIRCENTVSLWRGEVWTRAAGMINAVLEHANLRPCFQPSLPPGLSLQEYEVQALLSWSCLMRKQRFCDKLWATMGSSSLGSTPPAQLCPTAPSRTSLLGFMLYKEMSDDWQLWKPINIVDNELVIY